MDPVIVQPTTPDINEIVRIYAKEKGLSDTAAWALIRGTFVPRSEVLNIIEQNSRVTTQPQSSRMSEMLAQKNEGSLEKLKIEMEFKRMERQDRLDAEEREQKKIDQAERKRKNELDEARLAHEKETTAARLALDEKIAMRKLELEENRLHAKDEFDQKIFYLQIGKKPEEALEMVKNQEKFYERILTERTRHTEEVGDLKEDAEKKTKEIKAEMDTRFEKFIKENQNKPASDDFINKMKEYKKMQTEFLDMTFDTLEARGFDRKSLDEMRKVTNTKAKEQESGIGKIYDVGKLIWKNYIEPAADKASKELNAAPSGLDNRVSPEIEKRIREETDAKARQIEAENKVLQLQLEEEKKRIYTLQEERKQLEYRASELMIPYDDTVPNDHLFYMIEQQEAVIEQQNAAMKCEMEREKRDERARRARSTMPQEVAVPEVAIPDTEAEIDERYEASPQEPTKADEAPDVQADAQNNQIPRPDIHEELAIPRETSQETMDFMNEIGGTEGELMVKPEPEPESEMEEKPPEEGAERPKKEKEHHTKGKRKARPNSKFTVYKEDGTEIAKVESTNHKNAGLKIANQLNGTPDSPIRISVSDESGESKQYDAYSAEITNKKGTKYNVPRVKVV